MFKELAYYDGVYGTPEEVKVPFNDRVHFFGDGVYDATVGANGKVYLLKDHLDRFYSSARALDIRIPLDKPALGALLTDLLAKVEGSTHFVYWQVTRGVNDRDHTYPEGMPGKLWVMIRPNRLNDPDVPIKLITRPDTRFYHCNIKTLNLIPSVMAAEEAKRLGVQETVFHRGGIVTECAHSNVSILKNGVFYSHPNDELILRGIAKTLPPSRPSRTRCCRNTLTIPAKRRWWIEGDRVCGSIHGTNWKNATWVKTSTP